MKVLHVGELVRRFLPDRFTTYSGEPLNSRAQAALDEGILPPPKLMYLVAGTADANWFVDSGRLSLRTIEESLQRQGANLDQFSGGSRLRVWLRSRNQPFAWAF